MSMEHTSWVNIWIPRSENDLFTSKNTSKTNFEVVPVPEDDMNKTNGDATSENEEINDDDGDTVHSITIEGMESYEYRLQDYLKHELKNSRYITRISDDGNFILYSFQVKSSDVESIIIQLTRRGLGTNEETSVSVVQEYISLGSILSGAPSRNTLGSNGDEKGSVNGKTNGEDQKFYQTVKSRLMVAEVISRIRAGGNFTFDYCMLVILAGMIAFMGLVDNNSVTLVASMLVSPIMGPILAGIFGCVIQDRSLIVQGIRNEILSLLMCILIGMVLGILVSLMILYDVYGVIDVSEWPSSEMLSRGRTKGLVTGIFVAIPSGAGIALSVLGGNAGSLVGVAISASLLPPAVNAGVFWSISILAALYNESDSNLIRGYDNISWRPALGCSAPQNEVDVPSESRNNFLLYYHCDLAVDAFVCGIVSLTLTILNIICIIFTGFAILRIKEVTPDKIPQTFSNFWKKDIKAHRNYYKTLRTMTQIKENLNSNATDLPDHTIHQLDGTFLQNIFTRAHNDQDYLDITRWVAMPQPPPVSNEEKLDVNAKTKTFEHIIEQAVEEEKTRSSMTYGQIINQVVKEELNYSHNFNRSFSLGVDQERRHEHNE